MWWHKAAVCIATIWLTACTMESTKSAADPVPCDEPRPELCTQQYDPVCGVRDTGIRCVTIPCPSEEQKSYGNACSACSDPEVSGWRPGRCEGDK